MPVEYRILGPLEAAVDGQPARLGRAEAARGARRSCSAIRTPSSPPRDSSTGSGATTHRGSAANLVQGYVSGLRKALGKEAIETRGAGLPRSVVEPGALDLQRFERLAHEGIERPRAGRSRRAPPRRSRDALALWRGPALADLADEPLLGRDRLAPRGAARARARAAARGRARARAPRRRRRRSSRSSSPSIRSASAAARAADDGALPVRTTGRGARGAIATRARCSSASSASSRAPG